MYKITGCYGTLLFTSDTTLDLLLIPNSLPNGIALELLIDDSIFCSFEEKMSNDDSLKRVKQIFIKIQFLSITRR